MMLTPFHKSLVECFLKEKVDFFLIGGHAALFLDLKGQPVTWICW